MKKQFVLILALFAWLLSGGVSFASVTTQEDGSTEGEAVYINVSSGLDNSVSGNVATITTDSTVHVSKAVVALTAGTSVTLTVANGSTVYTDTITTDNQDQTITFSGAGTAGDRVTIIFTTDTGGSGDEVITFHSTLVNSVGTLTLANATADRYVVSFVSDGSKWNETARTAIQVT